MNILAIDIGTYSIKFVELKAERKNFVILDKQEIILDEVSSHYPQITAIQDLQKEIIFNYIQKKPSDTKIIFQLPNELITTRYLNVPGTSRRKVEQIIPFQLEENLPYSLANAHFSSRIQKNGNQFSVLSNIAQIGPFKDFYQYFENKDIVPAILTSEISVMQSYLDQIRMNETCCIVDLGHKTTKVYFVQNRQITSNHTSYIAGESINEVISQTYQISNEDAVIYKHANAFMLNDDQLNEVSDEQRNFALLMKQVFNPFILDLKRWEIGHRIKFGSNITKIYILGGTSNITNLDNFLYYHTGIEVDQLPPIPELKNDYDHLNPQLHLAKMMGISSKNPSAIINFLTGQFQTSSNSFISLHSSTFLWMRTTTIALLLILGFTAERFLYLQKQDKLADTKIKAIMKRTDLGISNADRRAYDKNPNRILNLMKRKNKLIKDEVQFVSSSQSINALRPLALISSVLSNNPKVNLAKFSTNDYEVTSIFTSEELEELTKVKRTLEQSGLQNLEAELNENQLMLTIKFEDQI